MDSGAGPVTESALDLRDRIANGALSISDLAEACIARIESREPELGAWAWFDAEFAREQAARLDAHRKSGRPIGPLHGVPVAIKDIIDTANIPTENGCSQDKGRVPTEDAALVTQLRSAGALILGKTVTTELAFMHPAGTRNPHDLGHTPGGSSSGSAAAVGDGMVPLAVGTQTGGSVIRPAAFCGVTGFKPSFGAIPRSGVLSQSPSLDTVGVFAADPLGAALIGDCLFGYDRSDPATSIGPAPQLLNTARTAPPLPPLFGFVTMPGWERAGPELHSAFDELKAALGEQVFEVPLPEPFETAAARRSEINFAEMAHLYRRYDLDQLGGATRDAILAGQKVSGTAYLNALDWRARYAHAAEEIFERCDAILCPSALGPAPAGLDSTGDAIFNGLWTLTGMPAVTLPLLTSQSGLPMGVQLVGPKGGDGRLLRTAQWLYRWADGKDS